MLFIMPHRPVRDQWDYPKKMDGIFRSNRTNQKEWLLSFFRFRRWVKRSRAVNRLVKMERQTSVGPPSDVVPNAPVRTNQIGPFNFTYDRNWISGIFGIMESTSRLNHMVCIQGFVTTSRLLCTKVRSSSAISFTLFGFVYCFVLT